MTVPPETEAPEEPSVERRSTSSGRDTLVVNGKFFHSRYDPLREAERVAGRTGSAAVVFVLSPGLGYLLDALDAPRVIGIERHAAVERAAGRTYWTGLGAGDVRDRCLALAEITRGRVTILSETTLEEDAGYYDGIRAAIEEAVEKLAEEKLTVGLFQEAWKRNLDLNRPLFAHSRWISDYRGRYRDATAVVFAAGPTLEEDARAFASMEVDRDGLLVSVAVDSALPAVLASGLTPDFCMTIDPQAIKAKCLSGLGRIPLVASVLSPPEITQRAAHLILYGQGHPDEHVAGVAERDILADTGGSVATAAVALMLYWGAAKVVVVGQDLAFVDGRMYAAGAPRFAEWLERLNRFLSFEGFVAADAKRRQVRRVDGVAGGKVWTTPALDSFRRHFEETARKHPDVAFYQTSRKGARIGGFRHTSLRESLKKNDH